MGQQTHQLPPASTAPRAERYTTEGFQANQHCHGRGENPYPEGSLRYDWWDQGWCEAELADRPEPQRSRLESWLAAGNA